MYVLDKLVNPTPVLDLGHVLARKSKICKLSFEGFGLVLLYAVYWLACVIAADHCNAVQVLETIPSIMPCVQEMSRLAPH